MSGLSRWSDVLASAKSGIPLIYGDIDIGLEQVPRLVICVTVKDGVQLLVPNHDVWIGWPNRDAAPGLIRPHGAAGEVLLIRSMAKLLDIRARLNLRPEALAGGHGDVVRMGEEGIDGDRGDSGQ